MSGVIMSGRRRGVVVLAGAAAVVVAAVVGFVALRGNGSESVATPVVTRTSSAPVTATSPVQTSSPVVVEAAPVMPAAAKKRDQKGAEAFFRYFIDVYNYSFSSLDTTAMRQSSENRCKFCASVVSDVGVAKERGLRYRGSELKLQFVAASPGKPSSGLLVVALMDQAAGVTLGSDGVEKEKHAAKEGIRVDAGLRWSEGGWRVFAVKTRAAR